MGTTEPYYTQQLAKQDEFWASIIQYYEEEIKLRTAEKSDMITSIQNLEYSINPFITYWMAKLSKQQPDLDVNRLLDDFSSGTKLTRSLSVSDTDLPNIEVLESFTIQDNDVLYMDIIRALAAEVQCLKSNINNLLQQEESLYKLKKEVDMIDVHCGRAKENTIVNRKQMQDMHSKLMEKANDIRSQITSESRKSVELRKDTENIMRLIAIEQQQYKDLSEGIQIEEEPSNADKRLERKIANVEEDIAQLRIKYDALKTEWYALSPKADEMKSNFNVLARQKQAEENRGFVENESESIETR